MNRHVIAGWRRLTSGATVPRLQISIRWFIAVCAVWTVAILYVVQEQLPRNVLSLPGQKSARQTVVNMAPQGWAFFTKSPRDPEVVPYGRETNNHWRSLSLAPHSSPHNVFGLDRRSRSQGIEIALLLSEAEQKDWKPCQGELIDCLADAKVSRRISNPVPEPTLCGTVAMVQEKPVPWSWRHLLKGSSYPDRVIALDVAC